MLIEPNTHAFAAHSALPWRAWGAWLLASLALHATVWAVWPTETRVLRLDAPPAPLSVRTVPPASPPAAPAAPRTPSTPAQRAAPPKAVPPPTPDPRPAPVAEPPAAAQPTAVDTPAAPASTPSTFGAPLPEAGSPGAELLPVPFAPSASWPYELRFDGEVGDGVLLWQRDGLRYQLQLERRTTQRSLPTWTSTGTVSPAGLAPEQFSSRGKRGVALQLAIDQAALTVSGPSGTLPVPRGVQDRLTWMLQLSAALSAQPAARAVELTVIDWRGRPQAWRLDWVADTVLRLSDGSERPTQLWRRQELGAAQAEIELWLDPDLGHLPVRIVHSVRGDERWELQLSPRVVPSLDTLPQVRTERDQSPTPKPR